jgi:hypothetical protein
MSAFHAICSEWPYVVILIARNILLKLLWSLVARIPTVALLSCPRKQLPSAFWHADICLTLSQYSSLNVRDEVLHPYETTGKLIILYILIFVCRQQTRRQKVQD